MPNHVWSYDFVSSTRPLPFGSSEGSTLPTVGNPGRCDDATRAAGIYSVHNGPEFIALALRKWITALELPAGSIEHGSPWTNGYTPSS